MQHDPKMDAVIGKIQKLLALAADERGNENQASAAAAKAQELLELYNLDLATIGTRGGREDSTLRGGLYRWQRDLWGAIASLHFCMYWSHRGLQKGAKYEHRVLGSRANVVATRVLAEYLQGAIERITREEYCGGDPTRYFKRDAIAYREGMAERIIERLHWRRWQREEEERRRRREEEERRRAAGEPVAHAVILADVARREEEANYDHLHGEGAWARREERIRQFNADWERREAERQAREAADRLADPEKWARIDAEAERRREREERRWQRREPRVRHAAHHEGYERGEDVSLDGQIDRGSTPRQIGG